jgi:hypothetical protein
MVRASGGEIMQQFGLPAVNGPQSVESVAAAMDAAQPQTGRQKTSPPPTPPRCCLKSTTHEYLESPR